MDGQEFAQYYRYCLQFNKSNVIRILPVQRVQARCFYLKYQKQFDNIAQLFEKYKLNARHFIDFIVLTLHFTEDDAKTRLVDQNTLYRFRDHLAEVERRKKVFGWFMKSVNNIAQECIDQQIFTVKDYLRELIKNKKLAAYYATGKISKYWFASIPSFKNVICKLDPMSRDELIDIYQNFELYNTEVNEAFMAHNSKQLHGLKFTEDFIFEKRNSPK